MKPFRYVYYAKLHLKLNGILQVGDSDDNGIGLAVNAQGDFILPATGIAGAIRHVLTADCHDIIQYFGTKDDGDSKIYFYDAVCDRAYVERRTGVKIDSRYGVAEFKKLYNTFYLGDGLTTVIKLQGFAEDEKEKNVIEGIVFDIAQGIASGSISFGAKTSIGAGIFKLTELDSLMLDLSKKNSETGKQDDLELFLNGVDVCFDKCEKKNFDVKENCGNLAGGMDRFRLTAGIPDALLVKSGELSDIADAVNMNHLVYTDDDQVISEYYIPGSSVKGLFRSYAETICKVIGLDKKLDSETGENLADILITELYGNKNETGDDEDKSDSKIHRKASKILFKDVPIKSPDKVLHSRVKIDRWLGGAIETAKMSEEILSTDEGVKDKDGVLNIEVHVAKIANDKLRDAARALVFLTCRDLARGVIPVGSGSSQGLGRLGGYSLYIGDDRLKINNGKVVTTDKEREKLQSWLDSLSELGNLDQPEIDAWLKDLGRRQA